MTWQRTKALAFVLLLLATCPEAAAPTLSGQAQERRAPFGTGSQGKPFGTRPQGKPVVEWARDGKVLIAVGGLLARFDLDSDEEELLDESGAAFALNPTANQVALGGANRLELRSYPDFKLQAQLALPDAAEVASLAWTPDGATLAAGTRAGHLLLWEVASRELWADLGIEPATPLTRLAFSADGKRLLSAYEDGRAALWDLEQQELLHRFGQRAEAESEAEPAAVALSADGRRVLVNRAGAEPEVAVLDEQGQSQWRRAGHGVEFTRDGAVLLLLPPFRVAALYPVEGDAEALRLFEPPESVETLYLVRLSPDGTKLLGVGEDPQGQVLVVWDFATARILKTRR